jgi:hypothetical protein
VGADREQLRSRIGELVAVTGNQELPGFGWVEISRPSRMVSYDPKALDQLMLELEAAGDPIAERIREAKREGQRVGSLKISRERLLRCRKGAHPICIFIVEIGEWATGVEREHRKRIRQRFMLKGILRSFQHCSSVAVVR